VQALASDVSAWTWGTGHTQTLRGPACTVSVIARPRTVVVLFGPWRNGHLAHWHGPITTVSLLAGQVANATLSPGGTLSPVG
jgi:hypothetical protein